MARTLQYIVLALLVVLTLVVGGLWLGHEPLTRDVLRPWLAEQGGLALDGTVTLEELSLAWGRVDLLGVQLVRADLDARLDRLSISFTLDGLLRRRLEEIVIERPEVLLKNRLDEEPSTEAALVLPDRAPITVAAWSIADGALRIELGRENYAVKELTANGQLGEDLRFKIAGLAGTGAGAGVAVELIGGGRWQNGLELTLEEFAWNDRSLLTEAVTVRPGTTKDLAVEVALSSLTDTEAARLLAAIGQPVPWPEELHWQVNAPTAGLHLAAGVMKLSLRTGAGMMAYAGRSSPWQAADTTLEQTDDAWLIGASIELAAGGKASAQGEWCNETFTGSLKAFSPQPAALAAAYGLALPTDLQQGQNLVVSAQLVAGMNRSTVTDGRVSLGWPQRGSLAGRFQGSWQEKLASLKVEQLTLTGPPASGVLATAAMDINGDPVAGAWQGSWQLASSDLLVLARQAGVEIADNLPNVRELQLAGRFKVQGKSISLPEIKMDGRLVGNGLAGRLHGQLGVMLQDSAGPLLDLQRLLLDEVEYSNAGGTVVVVGGRLTLAGQVLPEQGNVAFDLRGQVTIDEALVNSWYGSLKELPLNFTSRGRWLQKEQSVQFVRTGFDFAGLLSGELDGRLSLQKTLLNGHLAAPQMAGRLLETLQRLGGELVPGLKELELAGALDSRVEIVRTGEAWRLDLELHPDELTVGLGEKFAVSGLHGTLPLLLQVGTPPEPAAARAGRLTWRQLQAPLVDAAEGVLELRAAANHWQLTRPLEVAAAGGRARLNALQLSWQELTPAGEAALSIEDVNLTELSRVFGWPELDGRLSAVLGGIRFSAKEIVTSGEASAQAFGGTVRLRNLKVLAPLSRYPTYHADIDFSDLDLHALTRTFAFGEINGIASGHVHSLRLFDGTPSAFDARFETAASGTRNISVKAIRNLNTLSQGGLSAALSQGIYRFIDFYRYRKIGFSCSLRNDAFNLRGTARSTSDQYLIDGGLLPPRIDVIVSSPNISFKEMVHRLKRIERTEH